MPFSRPRTAPSGYEKVRILFHAIRTAQLLSGLIVGSFLGYFIWWLGHDNYNVPWTFIVLAIVSFLTVAFLLVTIVQHFMTGLKPRINLGLNTSLLILWVTGFAMLGYWSFGTLSNKCDIPHWYDSTGVMVCRIYKSLFCFSLTGLVSTIAALTLDFHIHRVAVARGTHMRLDGIDHKRAPSRGPYVDLEGRRSEAFEVPQRLYSAQPNYNKMQAAGYSMPEEQTACDTGYLGGHEERVFGCRN